jgi:hypothetical protein
VPLALSFIISRKKTTAILITTIYVDILLQETTQCSLKKYGLRFAINLQWSFIGNLNLKAGWIFIRPFLFYKI